MQTKQKILTKQEKIMWLIAILLMLILSLATIPKISTLPISISVDSLDNLKRAQVLAQHGTIGQVDFKSGKIIADDFREPFPIFLTAVWIKSIPYLNQQPSFEKIQQGKYAVLLKLQNIIYIFLVLLSSYFVSLHLSCLKVHQTAAHIFSIGVVLLVYLSIHTIYVETLFTEFHAAFLILWFTWAWLKALQSQQKRYFMVAGFSFGLLILTKAALMYIGFVVFLFSIFWLLWFKYSKIIILKHGLIFITAMLMVLPWYVRNYSQIGIWEFTQRGPVVLLTRAYKNAFNSDEFKGAFFAYAPASLKSVMASLTGYSDKDRLYGGRLQRLTRFHAEDVRALEKGDLKNAVGFYARAEIKVGNTMRKNLKKFGNFTQANIATNKQIQQEAMTLIRNDIPAHLRTSLVFAWRGAWPSNKVDGRWEPHEKKQAAWLELFTFAGLIAAFGLFALTIFKPKPTFMILTVLAVASFCFYALITHFVPRYSEMFIPIWIISICYLLLNIFQKINLTKMIRF